MTGLRQQLVASCVVEGLTQPFNDLQLARAAAAEANSRAGYPQLSQAYLRGDWDGDPEVQSALIAIRLLRQAESVTL